MGAWAVSASLTLLQLSVVVSASTGPNRSGLICHSLVWHEMKGSMVTIREVAKESGFSSTTVSIVLNNAPLARYIPAPTKKRIEKAAKKLGYRPNLFARSLRSKRSHTVGVMVFDMTDPFCTP